MGETEKTLMACPRDSSRRTRRYWSALRRKRPKQARQPRKPREQGPLLARREVLHRHNLHQLPRLTPRQLPLQMPILDLVAERSLSPRARLASRSSQRWKLKRRRSAKKPKKLNARDLPSWRRDSISMLNSRESVAASSISIPRMVIIYCP
jgi:hypothetical protein